MKLRSLSVAHFGCVETAEVDLLPGLHVLYGPNDLGKSTLAKAIRAALLLPTNSSYASQFVPWDSDETPRVTLTFEGPDGRIRRVQKEFGGSRGSAMLWESNDGQNFQRVASARDVEHELRQLLGWGVAVPSGRGGPKGLPSSFLATVILGEQADVVGVLGETLDADSDESGRGRLTAALEAFAQDPLFKQVLEGAQAKVDEAYSATGRRRRGQASPFVETTAEVNRARAEVERLAEQLRKTEIARSELDARRETVDEAKDALAAARARAESLRASHQQWVAHRALQSELAQAKISLGELEGQREALQERETKLKAVRADIDGLRAERLTRLRERDAANESLKGAEDALRRAESDEAIQARKLALAEIEKRELQLDSVGRDIEERLATLTRAQQIAEGRATALARRGELDAEVAARREDEAAATTRIASLGEDLELLTIARKVLDRDRARDAVSKLEATEAAVEEDRTRAAADRARADALAGERDTALPSSDELRVMRDVSAARDLALAKLGGGFAVTVERHQPIAVAAVADGVDTSVGESGAVVVEADRAMTVVIGDVATLTIAAGEADARREASEAQRLYQAQVQPVLQRCGATTLDELSDRRRQADDLEARIRKAREVADEADARAEVRAESLADLPAARAALAKAEEGLDHFDSDAVSRVLDAAGAASLEAQERLLRERRAAAESERDAAREAAQAAANERGVVDERISAADARLAELDLAEPDDGWAAERTRTLADRDELVAERDTLASRRESLEAEGAAERDSAASALEKAKSLAETAARDLEAHVARLEARSDEGNRLEGEVLTRRQQVASLDIEGARAAVRELEHRLEDHPTPAETVDEDAVGAAEAEVEQAEYALTARRDELRKAEGALEQVGGDVIRDETQQAREALERAEAREREVELDYEAWRLLVETLREAENTEGQHLGEALSQPVSARFRALTEGRYDKLVVGPDLAAQGLRASGDVREIASLSLGTQEQLATILRLTVAEHLDTMLVLDDHLTQTDATRGAWFRALLREHAKTRQIVVLTCRPLDYLTTDELAAGGGSDGRLHATDLAREIHRRTS